MAESGPRLMEADAGELEKGPLGLPLPLRVSVALLLGATIAGFFIWRIGHSAVTLADVAKICSNPSEQNGIATYEIKGRVRLTGRATFASPCRLQLLPGAELKLDRARVTTRSLVINDVEASSHTQVNIFASTVTGLGNSGFLIDLHDPGDTVGIEDSRIEYDGFLWIRVIGPRPDPRGGSIYIRGSRLSSLGESSAGIEIAAAKNEGRIRLESVSLYTVSGARELLFAGDCRAIGVRGRQPDCSRV